MRRRLLVLLAVFLAALLVAGLVLWAEADSEACMMWEGGRFAGGDSPTRPIWTTWTEFVELLGRWSPRDLGLMIGLSAAPFVVPALGALLVPARKVGGVWIALVLSVLLWVLLLMDPSRLHDCDRKGADAIFVVVPLGLLSGLCCLAAGLLLQGGRNPGR